MARNNYTAKQKAEALVLYREHGPTAVQKQLGIPKNTVASWAKASGVRTVRTSRTRAATEARSVDLKARRQELTGLLLEDAHRLRAQLWLPAKVINFGGKDNTLAETTLDEPLFVDKKNIMSSVNMALGSVIKLEAVDNDNGSANAKSMLERLAEQLQGVTLADDGFSGSSEPEATPLPREE
ncbi:hypothetical protein [Glutamicibacter arilaitensis]|uniref:hypothetical protein n=1 Tax=Glutamicibacter arilaitensis TaxID=256701 RepID=UPI00384D531C